MARQSGGSFTDREAAGEQLAAAVDREVPDADVVLSIPRGGLPVGAAVAARLEVPHDVVVASKIGAPENPEYAIGAVDSRGRVWLDDEAIDRAGIDDDYVEREREREADAARNKARRYRGTAEPPEVEGATVVLVDDGAATGSTAIAATRLARSGGADRVVVALPVAPPDTVDRLASVADDVVCLRSPSDFGAVGRFYDRFDQVDDETALGYLE